MHANKVYPLHTLCNGRQFAFLLWAELQHGVDDGQQSLPLAAGSQEDELQEDVLQVLQVGHTLLPLLVSLKTANFTLQQLGGRTYKRFKIYNIQAANAKRQENKLMHNRLSSPFQV